MRFGNSTRTVAVLAAVILTTGTVIAADPTSDPSAAASPSSVVSSPEASPSPSTEASEAPSIQPSTSPLPSVLVAPSKAPAASLAPEASEAPEQSEASETAPTDAEIADFVGRLKAAGITTTSAVFKGLAAKVGVGGAVRVLAFAQASGRTPAQIVAMRDGGKGWGQIVHELGLNIHPGIGWIMRGGHSQP